MKRIARLPELLAMSQTAGNSYLVLKPDNEARVRDGYTRLSTSGHARALPTRLKT
jgi:hypothetical protein